MKKYCKSRKANCSKFGSVTLQGSIRREFGQRWTQLCQFSEIIPKRSLKGILFLYNFTFQVMEILYYTFWPLYYKILRKTPLKQEGEFEFFRSLVPFNFSVCVPGQMFPPVVRTEGLLSVGAVVVGPTLRICVPRDGWRHPNLLNFLHHFKSQCHQMELFASDMNGQV